MKYRYYVLILLLISIICFISFDNTYAIMHIDDDKLIYNENEEIMKIEIYNYIDKIDNILIPNSSYTYSDILIENYDFLERFSVNYILSNISLYIENINIIDNIQYVKKEIIYESTKRYFNVDKFYIEDMVILENNEKLFDLKIKNINYAIDNNFVNVDVIYENNVFYTYTFTMDSNLNMYLYNVEVK